MTENQPLTQTLKGLLLVAVATVGWSTSGAFVRGLPRLEPWTINAVRGLNMALLLGAWMLARHGQGVWRMLREADAKALSLFAFFFALGTSLYILAIHLASVAAVSALGATSVFFAAVLARWWLGERIAPVFALAIGVAMVGVALIALGETQNAAGAGLLGVVVGLAVAATFAFQSVSLRRYHAMPMELGYVLGGLLVFALIMVAGAVQAVTWAEYLRLLAMGLVQLAIPAVCYLRGARYVSALQMVLISMADTFLNPLWVWWLYGEVPARSVFLGAVLILGAIVGTTLWTQRRLSTG